VRIFGAINWRVFTRGVNELWISPDYGLYSAGPTFVPVSSVAGPGDPTIGNPYVVATIGEGNPGVDAVDFEWDVGQRTATATATLRTALWRLWPGDAAALTKIGPASGTWLVSGWQRDLSQSTMTVNFVQPRPALPEPPVQPVDDGTGTTTGNASGTGTTGTSGAKGVPASAFLSWAMGQRGKPYVWGSTGPSSFDCSGFIYADCLAQGIAGCPRNSNAQFNWCSTGGFTISVDKALGIPGALLFLLPGMVDIPAGSKGTVPVSSEGHVAISQGNGRTVEAANSKVGVVELDASGRFNAAAYVPGVDYSNRIKGAAPNVPVAILPSDDGIGSIFVNP
jgi:cell wall-associated NlpC family hydrolase